MEPVTSICHHSSTLVAEVGQIALTICQFYVSRTESISFGVRNLVLTARTEGEMIALLIFVASQI